MGPFEALLSLLSLDWLQNFDLDWIINAGLPKCTCQVQEGFHNAYRHDSLEDFEQAMRDCAATCSDSENCAVLAGHSQGGAVAMVASLYLQDLFPSVIALAPPPALESNCSCLDVDRIVRYINTVVGPNDDGLLYDIVPLTPARVGFGQLWTCHCLLARR